MEAGYIRFNPTAACKLPRVEKAEIKPLSREQMGAFLKAIEGDQYETLFQVTIFTGMRDEAGKRKQDRTADTEHQRTIKRPPRIYSRAVYYFAV